MPRPLRSAGRDILAALGEPGAVVAISGAIETHAVLDSVQPTTDSCLGCLELIAGAAREVRSGDPVQVGVRYWTGNTVLTMVADAVPLGEPRTEDITARVRSSGSRLSAPPHLHHLGEDRHCDLLGTHRTDGQADRAVDAIELLRGETGGA